MPTIEKETDFRVARSLDFCYLCGKTFNRNAKVNRDHVPPKAIFAEEDRDCPLVLPTHASCNTKQSSNDEVIGQLIAVLHGKYPAVERLKLKVQKARFAGSKKPTALLSGINLIPIVWRWVRAFHAALYQQYLPSGTGGNIYPPITEAHFRDGSLVPKPILPDISLFTSRMKKNRYADNLDRICCWSGKCQYECVWARLNDGRWACVFCLELYEWENLGDIHNSPRHGCVGYYVPNTGIPDMATNGTSLDFPYPNNSPLRPFAD